MEQVCAALADLVRDHPDLSVVFPVHPNPRVRDVVRPALGGLERVHLIEPQGYAEFVALMKRSYLILTDSGGVQEEAPALGKPVLVLRDETERPEAVAAGTVQLVGTARARSGRPSRPCSPRPSGIVGSRPSSTLWRRLGRRADRPGRAPPARDRDRADAARRGVVAAVFGSESHRRGTLSYNGGVATREEGGERKAKGTRQRTKAESERRSKIRRRSPLSLPRLRALCLLPFAVCILPDPFPSGPDARI